MNRTAFRLLAMVLALIVGGSLAACGGDEHKDHKHHQDKPGDRK